MFFACPFARICFHEASILALVDKYADSSNNFTDMVWNILEKC